MAATLLRLTGSWVTRVAGKGALQATDAASTQLRFFSKGVHRSGQLYWPKDISLTI